MAAKLGGLVLALALALPAAAAPQPGTISGTVRSAAGQPQMGAAVEVAAAGADPRVVFTDGAGRYEARGLKSGVYQVKATAPSYLPSVRRNVNLRGDAGAVVNITLTTLFEALRMMPAGGASPENDDDWKWTLRAVGNRPVLRLLDPSAAVAAVSDQPGDRALKARLAFIAGSDGEGFGGATPGVSTTFGLERSLFSTGRIDLGGTVGYNGGGAPTGVFRAAYRHRFADGSEPEVAVTVRRFATATTADRHAALQSLSLSIANRMTLLDRVELQYGGELDSIEFLGRVTAFRPFGSVDVHLSPNTVLEYRYATAEPTMRAAKDFATAPADLSESAPRMSLDNGAAVLERAHHHELSLSRRLGKSSLQLAFYRDDIADTALTGIGTVSAGSGDFLPDPYAGTFTYNGGNLRTKGLRAVAARKLPGGLNGTLVYSYGGVLTLAESGSSLEAARFVTARRHAVAAKLSGRAPRAGTRWLASYRWTSGPALTPVDLFDVSPGQSDPYLDLFFRQPLPELGFLPGQVEALVDVRNLLAQGYVPVMGPDGHTVYLVQAPRSLRAGLAFSF
jgi:hypothetical protein